MNTENQNIDFLKTNSLNFQDSNLKVNKNSNSDITAHLNHKEVFDEKTSNSTKQARLNSQLILPKDNTPPAKVEINQLAKTWCELLLNQMQETQSIQMLRSDFEAKSNENIVSSLIS